MSGALNAKVHFAISIFTFGRIRSMFKKRGLKVTISSTDKDVLNLRTLNITQEKYGRCTGGVSIIYFYH